MYVYKSYDVILNDPKMTVISRYNKWESYVLISFLSMYTLDLVLKIKYLFQQQLCCYVEFY